MTAVWQTLIPETPSMEPISIIIDDLQNSRSENDYRDHNGGTNHYNSNSAGNNLLSPPQFIHGSKHRSLSGCSNNNNTGHQTAGNYMESVTPTLTINSENLTNTTNLSSSSSKSRAFHRISSSFNCGGEQFWRFYSDWRRRRLSQDEVDNEAEKRNQERFFMKSGVYNTRHIHVFERTRRYIRDIFTTLVDARWRWTLFVFSTSYILSWIGFAMIWWLIVSTHGDLDHWNDPDWQPCIVGVHSFTSVFLFSLETQHTIGYGTRYMNDTCPDAIFVLVAQSVAGVLIEAFMVGVVFAKLSRPKKRANTLLFSKNAVISQRDGRYYFMFRVGDIRGRSGLFECHVRAQVITKRVTSEGEVIPIHQEEIKVGGFGEDEDRILLFWPTVIVHPIDAESPFYKMSPIDLLKSQLEVIVVLEGVVESTGMTTQLRTSFLPSEILWGHRFHELSTFKTGQHVVFDFKLFNATFPVDTPHVSAYELDTERHHRSYGSLNGAETLPVSPQDSLHDNNSYDDNSPMRHRRKSVEVAVVNGVIPSRRLFSAPIDSSDDDDDEEEHSDSDNEESRIRTTRTRHESTSSLDSIVVSSTTKNV